MHQVNFNDILMFQRTFFPLSLSLLRSLNQTHQILVNLIGRRVLYILSYRRWQLRLALLITKGITGCRVTHFQRHHDSQYNDSQQTVSMMIAKEVLFYLAILVQLGYSLTIFLTFDRKMIVRIYVDQQLRGLKTFKFSTLRSCSEKKD